MAAIDMDNWIPIEWDSEVIARVLKQSAVESHALRHTMGTQTKRVLRSGGFDDANGDTYVDDESDLDYVTLTARRFTGKAILPEDDVADAALVVDTIAQRSIDWATSYANRLDNSALAVTGAENGGTVPFTSVYKAVRTNGTGAASDYVADANYVNYNGQASGAYDAMSGLLRLVEVGDYWDNSSAFVIAHPAFRDVFRRTKDTQGQPIFVQNTAGTPDTLFGVPVFWSTGARTSAVATSKPAGNPLMVFVGDARLLKLGVRSGPETRLGGSQGDAYTDDLSLKLRSRRGFAVGNVNGFSVLEKTA